MEQTADIKEGILKMKILVAEDEPDMLKIIRLYLIKEGYEVVTAADGERALSLACSEKFDLIVLDWMLPGMEGIEVCRQARLYGVSSKIIMLTAKSTVKDEIEGLTCGADDYVKKPFEAGILLLRIKKLLQIENLLRCGILSLNQQTQLVKNGAEELKLTKKEYLLLQAFMLHIGQVLTREQLLGLVWGIEYEGDERTLDTHVRRLRNKIGEGYIHTQVGLGYQMVCKDE